MIVASDDYDTNNWLEKKGKILRYLIVKEYINQWFNNKTVKVSWDP